MKTLLLLITISITTFIQAQSNDDFTHDDNGSGCDGEVTSQWE